LRVFDQQGTEERLGCDATKNAIAIQGTSFVTAAVLVCG
jgi:hypothetical protein